MNYFQSKIGITLGESYEQLQEASNYDSKIDLYEHSFQGVTNESNLNVFNRNSTQIFRNSSS